MGPYREAAPGKVDEGERGACTWCKAALTVYGDIDVVCELCGSRVSASAARKLQLVIDEERELATHRQIQRRRRQGNRQGNGSIDGLNGPGGALLAGLVELVFGWFLR